MARVTVRTNPKIHSLLESAYADFHSLYHRDRDPISLVYGYQDPRDREVAAFFAALLAYGNVQTILASVRWILSSLGPSPYRTVLDKGNEVDVPGFYHRFTRREDIQIVAAWLSGALRSHGSLEAYFIESGNPSGRSMKDLLSSFVRRFSAQPLPDALQPALAMRERSIKYLLSDPERGSACKRLNMFLRWMVREDDGIDLGLWKTISCGQLMLPIDTHLLQTLQALRWTRSKQATWVVSEQATDRLRLYCPSDPVRYDFALCHLSMTGKNIRDYLKPRGRPDAPLER